jgi:hypothetical protein
LIHREHLQIRARGRESAGDGAAARPDVGHERAGAIGENLESALHQAFGLQQIEQSSMAACHVSASIRPYGSRIIAFPVRISSSSNSHNQQQQTPASLKQPAGVLVMAYWSTGEKRSAK